MDARDFDRLTRALTGGGTRRSLLATVSTLPAQAGLLALFDDDADAADRRKRRKKRRRRARRRKGCYPGKSCPLGPGSNNTGCDFAGSLAFANANLQGATLARANLSGLNAQGADLRGADLQGACIVETNLLGAKFDDATNLQGAILCNTLLPDGSFVTSGCEQATKCCPACLSGDCSEAKVCTPVGNVCSVPFGTPCCPKSDCMRFAPSKFEFLTFCMTDACDNDQVCARDFPTQDLVCEKAGFFDCQPLADKCCKPKPCSHGKDCPHSGVCCNTIPELTMTGRCCAPGMRCSPVGCL